MIADELIMFIAHVITNLKFFLFFILQDVANAIVISSWMKIVHSGASTFNSGTSGMVMSINRLALNYLNAKHLKK